MMTFTLLRTIILAWLGACTMTLVLIDQDPRSQAYLVVTVRSLLHQALQAPTSVNFSTLRLGLGKATLRDVHIEPQDASWSWNTKALELHFSLIHLLRNQKLSLRALLRDSQVTSLVNAQGIAIAPAIKRLFSAGNAHQFITVSHTTIINNKVSFIHPAGKCSALLAAELPLVGRFRTSYIWWHDASLHYNQYHIVHKSDGVYRHDHEQGKTYVRHSATILPDHPAATRPLEGTATYAAGLWNMHIAAPSTRNNETLCIDATINHNNNVVTGSGRAPLSWLHALSTPSSDKATAACTGTLEIEMKAVLNNIIESASASLTIKDGAWNNKLLPSCTAMITSSKSGLRVDASIAAWPTLQAHITSAKDSYSVDIRTTKDSPLTEALCLNANSFVHIVTTTKGAYTGNYNFVCTHKGEPQPAYQGTFKGSLSEITLSGSTGVYSGTIGASTQGTLHITHATVHENEQELLKLTTEHNSDTIKGLFDVRLISLLAEHAMGPLMLGEGTCSFEGIISTAILDGLFKLSAGSTIRIPYLYNILEELSMRVHVEWPAKTFYVEDVLLNLHQGTIRVSKAEGALHNNALYKATIPYVAQNCLISWRKNVFALLSGAGTLSYTDDESHVKGFWIIEKGHMRNNILSTEFTGSDTPENMSQEKYKNPVHLDVIVMTRRPIPVKTSFLETQMRANVHLTGTLKAPSIKGDLHMLEGALLFPYKPLFIRQGTVSLRSTATNLTNNLLGNALKYSNVGYDPYVNIIAENSIKGYRVRMHVQGSLQNPELTFSATPHLPPEQIIALLFGGSEDGSIYVAMSTYIMQSIKQLLFGPTDSSSTILQSLKNLFRPLGSVRFVPSFTDQSSRGGIRGSLTLEVNERLRGMIKQNFDLPQDVMLEVEYDLSDDARIRAIKDERGDLGAEIEASWKF